MVPPKLAVFINIGDGVGWCGKNKHEMAKNSTKATMNMISDLVLFWCCLHQVNLGWWNQKSVVCRDIQGGREWCDDN